MVSDICSDCILEVAEGNAVEAGEAVPSCAAYEKEEWHWPRMSNECPLVKKFIFDKAHIAAIKGGLREAESLMKRANTKATKDYLKGLP
jgi:hypothetical protein